MKTPVTLKVTSSTYIIKGADGKTVAYVPKTTDECAINAQTIIAALNNPRPVYRPLGELVAEEEARKADLYVASVGRGVFEGKTLDILRRSMVEHYADASDDEPSCREADSIVAHYGDREEDLTADEVSKFNDELASDFADEMQSQRDEAAHVREISCPHATGRI